MTQPYQYKELKELIQNARSIVFFGGAGVSTESGIPDFRSPDGLYHTEYAFPPETILSHSFFKKNPFEFFRFCKNKMIYPNARPNKAHIALATLEQMGKLRSVITQNIDGLHQMAGSKKVLELHGSIHRNTCVRCGKQYALSEIFPYDDVPRCTCGGIIRPDVVLYEEALPSDAFEGAISDIAESDLLIVAGTSLNVFPAAGLIRYYQGEKKVLINKSETPLDEQFDLIIRSPVGEVLSSVVSDLE